jgi:hypothetical protein
MQTMRWNKQQRDLKVKFIVNTLLVSVFKVLKFREKITGYILDSKLYF